MTRLASVSVDLDSLGHYLRIQGLDEALLDEPARSIISRVALPRLLELFDRVGVPSTLFVIGEDLVDDALASSLRSAAGPSVELASHSHAHDYALSRLPRADIDDDLLRAHAAIEARTGVSPRGFRAPGYTLSPALAQAVAGLGYAYDASVFPAAGYYLAKAAVMGLLAVAQKPSRAILDSPRVLLAPRVPYRLDPEDPYRAGLGTLVELPMSVSPRLKLPVIGTFVTSLPWPLVESAVASLAKDALVSLELHALDVLDTTDGVPPALARQQRDLQVPAATKLERLEKVLLRLKSSREFKTLLEAAHTFAALV